MNNASPLAPIAGAESDRVLAAFIEAMSARGIELYEEQEEAILELLDGKHVILQTPTGSGKSLVAGAHLFNALCAGDRGIYTCPIKALVNEKFLALCREHGAANVGLMTGDASVNEDAPILCCTAEILANIALCGGERARISAVVMDEFHYYGDPERGQAWQIPLLLMPDSQFLLMSATLGHTAYFAEELKRNTGRDAVTVSSDRRPVPLEFSYSEMPLVERVAALAEEGKVPVYLVYFTQRAATEAAQAFISLNICSRAQREELSEILSRENFTSPFGKDLKRWLRHGIGVHHAGLLPRYRVLVESLAQRGLLKIICGTDTLGVGINVPIRTVLFSQLWKYDGRKSAILSVRDFRQIAGRAGRRGFDDRGDVIAQAPEHIIENKRAEEKAASGGKRKKSTKRSAPEGQPSWDDKTFEKLQTAQHEPLVASFNVSHGMLLQVLSRDEDGCRVMRQLIRDAHVTEHRKRELRRRAFQLFRTLIERGIVGFIPPEPSGRKLRLNVELQQDFALHHALSMFLVDALSLLDQEDPDYPMQVLSLCESILEDPDVILRKQLDKLKDEKMRQLKADGVPFEERIAKLEEMEHPKPMRDFLYDNFNTYREAHPWLDNNNVRPKSIAREMYEDYLSFSEYVRRYGLQRAEGVLLRHLSQTYKVLAQTVPDPFKTDPVLDLEDYLYDLLSATDSSLLDEWETLLHPDRVIEVREAPVQPQRAALPNPDSTDFQRKLRARIFGILRDVYADPESEAALLFEEFFTQRGRFLLDPEARSLKHSHFDFDRESKLLTVHQVLVDAEGLNDYEAVFTIDLSSAEPEPILQLLAVDALL